MFKIYDGRSHFYQWDIDRKLIVEDASISEVHFCNQTDNYSLVCKTYIEDGLNLVNVPNILLQNDWRINVYAYDSNYTKFSERFDVIQRCKPEDYVYTETEILNYNTLSDRIDAVDKNIETTVNDALTAAKASGEFDGADGITPTIGENGNWYLGDTDTKKPSRGADGKSAYSYAQDGGYTGTEAEFAAKLAAESLDKALFVVNITQNGNGTFSADKTFDEIVQVYNEGKYSIVANFALNAMNTLIVPFLTIMGAGAAFGEVVDRTYFTLLITSNNEVQMEMFPLATLQNKLPNPYPLTFTGAVSETYDGSSAKTIEIPSGGAYTASYIVEEDVSSYTLNIDTSKYSGYVIFVRNSTNKAPSITINREHKRIGFTGYDANVNFFEINTLSSDGVFHGFSRLQKNNNTSAAYYSYGHSNHASGTTEENNGIVISAETIGAGSEIFVRCM